MAKELDQPGQRSYSIFVDQHGREWGTVIDIRTGHSAGQWEPKFEAPWYPEYKYIRHVGKNSRHIFLDYDQNIADLRDAHDEYDELRLKTAMDQYGNAFTQRLGKTHDEDPPELKRLTGKPPFPIAWAEAAKEGNRWVLGFSNLIPKWAYPLLHAANEPERKYLDAEDEDLEKRLDLEEAFDPEATGGKKEPVSNAGLQAFETFMAEQKAAGKSHKEAQAAWRERKAAVAS